MLDGDRIDPCVSVPIENATQPAAVADPGPGRRSARPFLRVPRIVGAAAEPAIALRQRAERELGDEHRAGVAQPLDDRGVVVEDLLDRTARRPRSS